MTIIQSILSPDEAREFDTPPQFNTAERQVLFQLSLEAKGFYKSIRTPINRLTFILHYGYFRARGRFFKAVQFHFKDIQWVCKQHFLRALIPLDKRAITAQLERVSAATTSRYMHEILRLERWREMDALALQQLEAHARWQAEKQTGLDTLFLALTAYCWKNRCIIPSYTTLCEVVSRASRNVEERLFTIVDERLTPERQAALLELLGPNDRTQAVLVEYRTVDQSIEPRALQENARLLSSLKQLYLEHLEAIEALDLNEQAVRYYAGWVTRASSQQVRQLRDRRTQCLYLLAFIIYQFRLRQDYAVDAAIKAVRSLWSTAQKQANERVLEEQVAHVATLQLVMKSRQTTSKFAHDIIDILNDPLLSDAQKVERTRALAEELLLEPAEDFTNKESAAAQYLNTVSSSGYLYEILEKRALSLIQRLNSTLKILIFDPEGVAPALWLALESLQQDRELPSGFLSGQNRSMAFRDGEARRALIKVLLFKYLVEALKSGQLNLQHCFRYRHLQTYMIAQQVWEGGKPRILEQAGLTPFADGDAHLNLLKARLDAQFVETNRRFSAGENGFLNMRPSGRFYVKTPALETVSSAVIGEELAQEGSVPILRILREIERTTPFLHLLTHHSRRNVSAQADPQTALAGILALGCNIGPRKMATRSIGIKEDALVDLVNWRFSNENLKKINDVLVRAIDDLPLSEVYKVENGRIHSSSDGKKVTVAVDSTLSNFSYKYFGREKGTVSYGFIDEKCRLFYSTVISSTDREAAYVLDGLMHNATDTHRIHATDTHGYTEALFGACHLLGIGFAPRIKGLENQSLYSLTSRQHYLQQGYRILPSRSINRKLILSHWDEILRFIASIGLGQTSASQLFRRLNSYSKDHPLYQALKELGRIIKTQYILTYYDDLTLRQRVQKQLNIMELSNRLHDAVFWARGHEFHVGTQEEQEKYTLCRTILQNAVILWNYLTLSVRLLDLERDEPDAHQALLEGIRRGSVLTWRHVNFNGEYDFTKPTSGRLPFPLARIRAMEIPQREPLGEGDE